jgi:hypothetical protein
MDRFRSESRASDGWFAQSSKLDCVTPRWPRFGGHAHLSFENGAATDESSGGVKILHQSEKWLEKPNNSIRFGERARYNCSANGRLAPQMRCPSTSGAELRHALRPPVRNRGQYMVEMLMRRCPSEATTFSYPCHSRGGFRNLEHRATGISQTSILGCFTSD